jgi:hypothetical protein
MPNRTCDRCTTTLTHQSATEIDHAGTRAKLCQICARDIIDYVDSLIDDGMARFSPVTDDRCPNCLIPFDDDTPIRIAIGPWRRHTLCLACAEPIISMTRRARPENLDAYDLYLRALPLAWAFSPEQTAKAIPLLDRALLLDPGYAAVHGLAAFCHLRGFAWGNLSDAEKSIGVHRTVLSADTDDAAALAFSALGIGFMDRDSDAACSDGGT